MANSNRATIDFGAVCASAQQVHNSAENEKMRKFKERVWNAVNTLQSQIEKNGFCNIFVSAGSKGSPQLTVQELGIVRDMIIKENETLRGIVTVSEDTESSFDNNETNTWTTVGIRVAYPIRR